MNNKFIRYCIVETKCRLKIAALVVLIIVMIGQWRYRGAQIEKFTALQTEFALVGRVGNMEEKLRTRGRMEAFRNEENIDLANIKPKKISGIAMQKGVPSVLVDGTVYSEGSTYGEYIIVKITKKMITLVNKKTNAIKNLYVFE